MLWIHVHVKDRIVVDLVVFTSLVDVDDYRVVPGFRLAGLADFFALGVEVDVVLFNLGFADGALVHFT
jgi:hypothetical protein